MPTQQKKIIRLRQSLEPLAVLYEKAVLEALREPSEVRFTIRKSTDHPSETCHGDETVHIIDGECLRAAHETWQGLRRTEREFLEQNGEAWSDVDAGEQLPDEPAYLNASEREWLEWFYHLSDEDKRIVEECGEKDISVTSDNLDEMKQTLEEQETKEIDSVIQLFKS